MIGLDFMNLKNTLKVYNMSNKRLTAEDDITIDS